VLSGYGFRVSYIDGALAVTQLFANCCEMDEIAASNCCLQDIFQYYIFLGVV
jgi:hypothetical protein